MKPSLHVISSLGLAAWIGYYLQSLPAFFATTTTGIFIDIDHLIDYVFHWYKKSRAILKERPLEKQGLRSLLSLKNFMNTFYYNKTRKVIIVLHSFEWTILLGIAYLMTSNIILLSCFAGHTLHLVFDALFNKPRIQGYFLIYRIKCHFSIKLICSKDAYLKNTFLGKYLYPERSNICSEPR